MIDLKFILKATTVVFMTIAISLISSVSFAKTEVRIMWYGDGETEGKAMQDQLDKFMAKNPDISVILDQVPYKSIQDSIKNIDLLTLMNISNVFGRGFGKKKLELILNQYPNIIELYETLDKKTLF